MMGNARRSTSLVASWSRCWEKNALMADKRSVFIVIVNFVCGGMFSFSILLFSRFCFVLKKKKKKMEQSVSGVLVAWTVPKRDRDGFTSVLSIDRDDGSLFSLSVTLPLLEDHTWHTGQCVVARDVLFDSLARGRTYDRVGVHEQDEPAFPFFLDLAVNKIVAFHRMEGGALAIGLDNGAMVMCVDEGKCRELLEIGIGGCVQLFNVKSTCHGLFVTAKSGVRSVAVVQPLPPPLSPPRPCEPPRPPCKWQCIVCGWLNYPSKSVCLDCNSTRKEGPLYKNERLFLKRESVVKRKFERLPQWMCKGCRHRDNFYFRDTCVKCGEKRRD